MITPYSPQLHKEALEKLKLGRVSRTELGGLTLRNVLQGLSPDMPTYVFRTPEGRVFAVGGLSRPPGIYAGVLVPWFLSDATESDPRLTLRFLRETRQLVRGWFQQYPKESFFNRCLPDPAVVRWLQWLGFEVRGDKFYKGAAPLCVYQL